MKNEKMDLEQKRAAYVEAYHAAMADLVPDFNAAADKESGNPWCLVDIDEVNADTVGEIKAAAKADAEKHAPEIARLVADDLENVNNMPRIILTDNDAYNIYDVNNCLDIFGRCENGIDFDAIKEAFNRSPKMMDFGAFKDFAKSFEEVENA